MLTRLQVPLRLRPQSPELPSISVPGELFSTASQITQRPIRPRESAMAAAAMQGNAYPPWAAQQLAEDSATVQFPAPADIDPAFWQPDLATIGQYQGADLVLLNGAGYARWLARVSMPRNRLVDTSRGFSDQLIALDSGPAHSHGPEGDHSHGEKAFTVWLDLDLYRQQVEVITDVLAGVSSDRKSVLHWRRDKILSELGAMDEGLQEISATLDGASLLYSHPVYQYLERRYGLNGLALHWEPDVHPDAAAWAELEQLHASHPAQLMLWEEEPLPETRDKLAQRGIQVVVFRPMGNRPAVGDFASGMAANIGRFRQALNP